MQEYEHIKKSSDFEDASLTDGSASIKGKLSEHEAKQLSERLELRNKRLYGEYYQLQTSHVKCRSHNLARQTVGRYVVRSGCIHQWKSTRSRYLWGLIQAKILGPEKLCSRDEDELKGSLETQQNPTILNQGFKHCRTIKSNFEIISLAASPKNNSSVDKKKSIVPTDITFLNSPRDTNEDEDFYDDREMVRRATGMSLCMIDSQRNVSFCDIFEKGAVHPYQEMKINNEVSSLLYLSKTQMYAGLTGLFTISFFNVKLEPSSYLKSEVPMQSLFYEEKRNELVGIGTHHVALWSLDSVKDLGQTKITALLIFIVHASLSDDDWISSAMVLSRTRQIYIAIGTDIHILSMDTGDLIRIAKNVMTRRISCLACHETYLYVLVGGVDGTIKVINIFSAVVHEFVAHSKAVVSIVVFPSGPLFVTCGQDQTVRLFNLKYFKSITAMHTKEKPLEMFLLEESYLIVKSRNCIDIWEANHFTINFSNLSMAIADMKYFESFDGIVKTYPSRIFCRTVDGVARLISPINGRNISATLPLTETFQVIDMAYFAETERLYILLKSGEIFVYRTDQNPCTITEKWNNQEYKDEGLCKLVICSGQFNEEDQLLCPPSLRVFGFLLSATKNGCIILLGRSGIILDRYQLHFGKITQILFEIKGKILISAGEDGKIRISTINPFDINIIQIKIDIMAGFIPQALSYMNSTVCVAAPDTSIYMFNISIFKREWKLIPKQIRDTDHTEKILSIINEPLNDIFISISQDRSMRVWTRKNQLLRQVQFEEELSSICLANDKGDVLVGIGSRIDILKASTYLPPGYYQKLNNSIKPHAENVIVFDEHLVSVQNAKNIETAKVFKKTFDPFSQFELFALANLLWHTIFESEDDSFEKKENRKHSSHGSNANESHVEKGVVAQRVQMEDFLQKYKISRLPAKNQQGVIQNEAALPAVTDELVDTLVSVCSAKEVKETSQISSLEPRNSIDVIQKYKPRPKNRVITSHGGYQPNTLGKNIEIVDKFNSNVKISPETSKGNEGQPKSSCMWSLGSKFAENIPISKKRTSDYSNPSTPESKILFLDRLPKSSTPKLSLLPSIHEKLLNYSWNPIEKLFHTQLLSITSTGKTARTPIDPSGQEVPNILIESYYTLPADQKKEMVGFLLSNFPLVTILPFLVDNLKDQSFFQLLIQMEMMDKIFVSLVSERYKYGEILKFLGLRFDQINGDALEFMGQKTKEYLRSISLLKKRSNSDAKKKNLAEIQRIKSALNMLRGRNRFVRKSRKGTEILGFEDYIDGLNYFYLINMEQEKELTKEPYFSSEVSLLEGKIETNLESNAEKYKPKPCSRSLQSIDKSSINLSSATIHKKSKEIPAQNSVRRSQQARLGSK